MAQDGHLEFVVSCTDGHRYRFRQPEGGLPANAIELLHRTKAFTQKNLVFHTEGGLVTFPSPAVARLDLITDQPLSQQFAATWRNAREICGQEAQYERDAILNHPDEWRQRRETGSFTVINIFHSLGGYETQLLFDIVMPEGSPAQLSDFDEGMMVQHAPPPAYVIHHCDGIAFLNTATIVRMQRIPGFPVPPVNALTTHAREILEAVSEDGSLHIAG